MKVKCNCGKEVDLDNIHKTLEIFEYIGVDDHNNPLFKCRKCNIEVSG